VPISCATSDRHTENLFNHITLDADTHGKVVALPRATMMNSHRQTMTQERGQTVRGGAFVHLPLRWSILRVVATNNASPELRAFIEKNPIAPGRGSVTGRAVLERRTVQVLDAQADPEYSYGSRQVDPVRTIITVPILRGDELLGVILIYRHEVRAFTESQIALLETFADQAGIAIENARRFEEVQARTGELSRSVAELKALGQVSKTVNSSLDLNTVLDAILGHACEISDTAGGAIYVLNEENDELFLEAGRNMRGNT
jgi:signal transduction protein with GAF and PtsI domain